MALEFNDANFESEVLKSDKPVLVDFWAPWCGPCVAIAPMIDQLSTEIADTAKVGKVNVDDNPDISMKYGVRSIPTLLIFKGGEVVEQMVGGGVRKDDLAAKLKAQAVAA